MARTKIKRKGDNLIKDALILFGITVILGLILGCIYMATKNPIDEAAEAAKQASYKNVFTGYEGVVTQTDDEFLAHIEGMADEEGKIMDVAITDSVVANDASGNRIGYAFIAQSNGYGGALSVSVGVSVDGVVTGIDIVSMNETAGLGAKCTEADFKAQYVGKSGEIVVSKSGASAENEVDALSGATITTNAVTRAVNACISVVNELGGKEAADE